MVDSSNHTVVTVASGGVYGRSTVLRQLMPELQTLEVLLAVTIFVTIHSLRQKKKQGLPVWPVIGMLPSMVLGLRGNTYEWVTQTLIQQGGTFVFKGPWFSSLNSVLTADPRNLEHLLKSNFKNFPKGKYFREALHDLLGNGIFNADDETWQRQRKTASIEFHSTQFRNLTASSLVELVHDRLLPVLEEAVETTTPFDLQNVLLRLTFDNVCMIAFGVDPGCLRPGLPVIPFAQAFEEGTEAAALRFVMPMAAWKAMRFFNLGNEARLKKSIKAVDEFADEVIRTRKKELELESEDKASSRSDLLTIFMRLKDDDEKPYSDKFLRDICVNFILAGRDTSSVALAWFFWLLNQNPEVEKNILSEIHRILAERDDSDVGSNISVVFNPEEVKKMDYLQAALTEALRLYPSVPLDHKEVTEDDVFPDGTVLKKGTKIIYGIYPMGRMESIWGKDCSEFKPERWLRDGRFVSESAYKFTAFNGGPRLCLGKDFAYYQMKFVAAAVIYRYRVDVVPGHPVAPKLALTMYMKYGLKVTLCKRDQSEVLSH
ncbi:cytochrome P450 86B1-like [Aristolochia californica]|uniref:cytochrome P450 86B1-like n=1 Tax=Aristolochia californica TaxID=171875 RepID=UPI0035D7B768